MAISSSMRPRFPANARCKHSVARSKPSRVVPLHPGARASPPPAGTSRTSILLRPEACHRRRRRSSDARRMDHEGIHLVSALTNERLELVRPDRRRRIDANLASAARTNNRSPAFVSTGAGSSIGESSESVTSCRRSMARFASLSASLFLSRRLCSIRASSN